MTALSGIGQSVLMRAGRSATPRSVRAFTLMELLLAAVIVAVLAVSGIAAWRWAVMRSAITVSSNNLRNLVTANLNYAADDGGWYCPAQESRNLKRWHGSRDSVADEFEPRGGFLSPYFGNDTRLETCPLLQRLLKDARSFEDGAGGYGYNATYVGGRPGRPFEPARIEDLADPSRTIMFATTAFSKADGLQEYPFVEPYYWPLEHGGRGGDLQPSLHFRADGRAIVAWCDGRITLEEPRVIPNTNYYGGDNERDRIGFIGPEEDNGWWNPKLRRAR